MKNQMTLTLNAISENEAFARNAVASFCVPLNPTVDQLDEIKTAVSEAVTNCVVHAYPHADEPGKIEIFTETTDGAVHIRITDFGTGINDVSKAVIPFFTTETGGEHAGIGFTVMKSFMDSVEVANGENGGLIVSMRKYLIKEG